MLMTVVMVANLMIIAAMTVLLLYLVTVTVLSWMEMPLLLHLQLPLPVEIYDVCIESCLVMMVMMVVVVVLLRWMINSAVAVYQIPGFLAALLQWMMLMPVEMV